MKIFIDCSNITTDPRVMKRTGIQEVVFRILENVIPLRERFPALQLVTCPRLPQWDFPYNLRPCVPHFNPSPDMIEAVDNTLRLPSKEIWGIDLRKRQYRVSDGELKSMIREADLFYTPSHIDLAPVKTLNKRPCAQCHDLTPIFFPEYTDYDVAQWTKGPYVQSLRRYAHLIVSDSRNTAYDLLECLGPTITDRLVVLPLAFPERHPERHMREAAYDRLSLQAKGYIVILGSMEPRKNFFGMLAGFERFCELNPDSPLRLVIAGGTGWKNEEILRRFENSPVSDRYVRTGYVDDALLSLIIERASGLMMLSHYEGFGIPVAMAVSHGIPAITSLGSSLPEACAGDAVFVDSFSPTSVAYGIERVMTARAHASRPVVQWGWRDYTQELLTALVDAVR